MKPAKGQAIPQGKPAEQTPMHSDICAKAREELLFVLHSAGKPLEAPGIESPVQSSPDPGLCKRSSTLLGLRPVRRSTHMTA